MVNYSYVPDRGDLIWLDFDPQSVHEQKGKRPALVLSPKEYNQKVRLGFFCPMTSREKDYPFEVKVKNNKIQGVILSDQIKSLDWTKRNAEFISKATDDEIAEVADKISKLVMG
jgi:mRNA interferase MazF